MISPGQYTKVISTLKHTALLAAVAVLPFHWNYSNVLFSFFLLFWLLEARFGQKLQLLKQNIAIIGVLTALFWLQVFGMTYASDWLRAYKAVEYNFIMLLLPLAIFTSQPMEPKMVRRLCIVFVLGVVAGGLACEFKAFYLNITRNEPLHYLLRWRHTNNRLAQYISIDANYLGMYVVAAITILFYGLEQGLKRTMRIAAYVAMAFLFVFLLHLFSRLALMMAIVTVIFFVVRSKRYKLMLSLVALAAVFFVLIFTVDSTLPVRLQRLNPFNEEKFDKRPKRWQALTELIQQRPVFGTGSGNDVEPRQEIFKKYELNIAVELQYNAHNQFLEYLITHGAVGLLLYLFVLFYLYRAGIANKSLLYVYLLSIFVLASQTESMLDRNKGIIYFTLLNAVFFSALLYKKATGKQPAHHQEEAANQAHD